MRKVLFILGQLSDTDADWLARIGQRQKIAAGTELIRHGTHIDTIYIVLEGSLSVLAANGVKLADVGCGDVLGEMSLVDSGLTAASVRGNHDSVVLAVPKRVLQEKLNVDAPFAARFYRAISLFLADRMRNTIRRMGYGTDEPGVQVESDLDELDPEVLDRVHLAGARFERLLRMTGNWLGGTGKPRDVQDIGLLWPTDKLQQVMGVPSQLAGTLTLALKVPMGRNAGRESVAIDVDAMLSELAAIRLRNLPDAIATNVPVAMAAARSPAVAWRQAYANEIVRPRFGMGSLGRREGEEYHVAFGPLLAGRALSE